MRITDLHGCEIRPGRLVEWTLDPVMVEAATRLPDDSRPPAYVQESHLRTARSLRQDGLSVPAWLGVAFDIPGPVDLDVLEGALRTWTLRHETLRSGFRWGGDELRRFTTEPGAVALRRDVVGDYLRADELRRHLQKRFDEAADALGWPSFLYTAVVRADSTSVYLAFDHSNVDAYSLQRIPSEIAELCTDGRAATAENTEGADDGASSSYVDFCAIERADADEADHTHPVVERWREFIARCDGRLPAFPVALGLTDDGSLPPQKFLYEMLVDDAQADAFATHCRPSGGSQVGLLAATALVVHTMNGQPSYRTVVPLHTRAKSRWTKSVGWYVGCAPVEIPVAQARGFDDALRMVRASLRANKSLARLPVARVLKLLGSDFRPTSPDLFSIVSFVDARDVPGAGQWEDLKSYLLLRVSYGDQVCVWFTRLHEGLHVAIRYPDTPVAHENMRHYVEQLRELIGSVGRGEAALPAAVGGAGADAPPFPRQATGRDGADERSAARTCTAGATPPA
ncbi:condensation domain-containing protein [Streptomyces sp. NPDC058657]|uniref:condensation domain-containing protein n=1 Tax=unclassified Streptomyces TaxID=2593676 RepID=UPI00364BC4B5